MWTNKKSGFYLFLTGLERRLEHCVSLRQRMNADHYCALMHPFPPNSRMRTRLKRSNGKSSKQFQKSLFMYLEERRQLEKALYFKAVGIPKQACYWCFFNTGQGKDR